MRRRRKSPKIGRRILLLGLLARVAWALVKPLEISEPVRVVQGDTLAKFWSNFSAWDRTRAKFFLRFHPVKNQSLGVGNYFAQTGDFSVGEFRDAVARGPQQEFERVTVLEGWSIFDLDAALVARGLIEPGAFTEAVRSSRLISRFQKEFDFLEIPNLRSLEGFLYPDTFFVDESGDFVENLIAMQLAAFDAKVWEKLDRENSRFRRENPQFSWYDFVTLVSVVQKEERTLKNKPVIAGLFLNRLAREMRLDADITLCYFFAQPYADCTPAVIGRSVADASNPFNTRRRGGLPPQPIASAGDETFFAVNEFVETEFLYYLHDPSGQIHFSETLDEHNAKKNRYLR